jgi:ABC-type multidrug transport system fused ATPase/permease subunit
LAVAADRGKPGRANLRPRHTDVLWLTQQRWRVLEIVGLSERSDSRVGGFSHGMKQRLGIAQALLHSPELIVLDEPTSLLDPLAEAEVFEHFRRAVQGRSAVLISHRFSTVRMADYIYVLDHGRVAESGTHQGLLDRGGLYARLYSAQAARYQDQPQMQKPA